MSFVASIDARRGARAGTFPNKVERKTPCHFLRVGVPLSIGLTVWCGKNPKKATGHTVSSDPDVVTCGLCLEFMRGVDRRRRTGSLRLQVLRGPQGPRVWPVRAAAMSGGSVTTRMAGIGDDGRIHQWEWTFGEAMVRACDRVEATDVELFARDKHGEREACAGCNEGKQS